MMRQGDILVRPVSEVPGGSRVVPRDAGRVVLAYGEVTGHAHAIAEPGVELRETPDGRRWLRVPGTATVRHEEHATLTLAPGAYQVIRQREWTDEDEPRQVAD